MHLPEPLPSLTLKLDPGKKPAEEPLNPKPWALLFSIPFEIPKPPTPGSFFELGAKGLGLRVPVDCKRFFQNSGAVL